METLASKNLFWSLLNLILAVILIFGVKGLFSRPFYEPAQTISVEGEGKVTVVPDIAVISFAVISEGKDPAAIQDENSKKMNAAIEFVKAQGIADKDIKTTGYSLYPKYDFGPPIILPDGTRKQEIIGYTLTQTVRAKVRDLKKVSGVLGGLPPRGINEINSVSLDVDDPNEFMNQARSEAFSKAREKALAMAKAAGVRLRRVVTFSEGGRGWPGPIYLEAGKGGDLAIPAPQIEPGSQEIVVNVSVTYEIR